MARKSKPMNDDLFERVRRAIVEATRLIFNDYCKEQAMIRTFLKTFFVSLTMFGIAGRAAEPPSSERQKGKSGSFADEKVVEGRIGKTPAEAVFTAVAEEKPLTAVEARRRVGEKITVEMTVQSAKDRLEKRGEIYLDSEPDFRDEKNFAVIITKAGAMSLKEAGIARPAGHFRQKKIRATGLVKEVDRVPCIEIDNAKQIKLAERP